MASISNYAKGGWTIEFTAPSGKKAKVRLGHEVTQKKQAQAYLAKVEALLACAFSRTAWDPDLAAWVRDLPDKQADRLARAGLIPPRKAAAPAELGPFLADYIGDREGKLAPNSITNLRWAEKRLVAYFGADRRLAAVTPGEGDKFLLWLSDLHAAGTVERAVKRARQFFRAACRLKLIAENPFADVKAPAGVDRSRQRVIGAETVARVIGACPDAEWRLIVALARYGGIRVPSELLPLRWDEVLWDEGRFLVHSPKTAHHRGGDQRWVPIFAELRPHLEAAWAEAAPGAVHLIEANRKGGSAAGNWRTRFMRIITRAGVEVWPKLFVNLRASRATELVERFPEHVVNAWLGQTEAIAQKHYRQVTDEHFRRAAEAPAESGEKSGEQVGRIVGMPATAAERRRPTVPTEVPSDEEVSRILSAVAVACRSYPVPPRGIAASATTPLRGKHLGKDAARGGANSGAAAGGAERLAEALLSMPPRGRAAVARWLGRSAA